MENETAAIQNLTNKVRELKAKVQELTSQIEKLHLKSAAKVPGVLKLAIR